MLSTLILVLCQGAGAVSLGVSPSSVNLGSVERGETASSQFYLTANSLDQRFRVEPKYVALSKDTYDFDLGRNYSVEQVNRRNWENWLSFPRSGDVVDPSTSRNVAGNEFEAQVNFSVAVPPDAEPGWYAAKIRVNPRIDRDPSGGQIVLRSVSRPTVSFRVPGRVTRQIDVVRSRGFRTGDNKGTASLTLRNEGSATAVLNNDDFEVLGPQGLETDNVEEDSQVTILSGEARTVRVNWQREQDLEAGNYQIQGVYNHMTGAVFVDESVQVTDFIRESVNVTEPNEDATGVVGQAGGSSTWVILILLVLLAVVLYSFEIDPVWILVSVGLLGIAAAVFVLNLPMWVLVLTVAGTAVTLYVA